MERSVIVSDSGKELKFKACQRSELGREVKRQQNILDVLASKGNNYKVRELEAVSALVLVCSCGLLHIGSVKIPAFAVPLGTVQGCLCCL